MKSESTGWVRTATILVLCGAAAFPLVISYEGNDHFRLPKDLLLYAVALASVAVIGGGLLLGYLLVSDQDRRDFRGPALVVAAGLCWTLVATVLSTQRTLSAQGFVWTAALAVFFFASWYTARRVSLPAVAAVVLIPAVINAVVVMLQASRIWNPWVFPPGTEERLMKNALLGNPDDVGVYLLAPTIFAATAALQAARWRAAYAGVAGLLSAALFLTETFTAIGALLAALTLLVVRGSARARLRVASAVVLAAVLAMFIYGPTRQRVLSTVDAVKRHEWSHVVRGRYVPAAAAWKMFVDDPMTGAGPGTYKFHYMANHVRVEREHPRLSMIAPTESLSFRQAHNDFLQILAETGLPGLVAVLAALAMLARVALGGSTEDTEKTRIARTLAAPLTLGIVVTMIPLFPWHLTATAGTTLFLAAGCFAWSTLDP